MIQRRISLSPLPAPPVNSGEPLNTMAARDPGLSRALPSGAGRVVLKFAYHIEQEEQCTVVDPRKLATVATEVRPEIDNLLFRLPVHTVGRIG